MWSLLVAIFVLLKIVQELLIFLYGDHCVLSNTFQPFKILLQSFLKETIPHCIISEIKSPIILPIIKTKKVFIRKTHSPSIF